MPALPLPQHIAEKVHAYTRKYGPSERESTRPKDLVDILLIAQLEKLDAASLRSALETTFRARGMQLLPSTLPPPPASWEEHYRRLAAEVEVEPDLDKAFAGAAAFLDPILAGSIDRRWDPGGKRWM